MTDSRVTSLARILVAYSTRVKEGEVVSIDGESAAEPLLAAVYEEVLKAGGHPILNVSLPGQSAAELYPGIAGKGVAPAILQQ